MVSLLDIFCCYAREDQVLMESLRKHLKPLQRRGLIKIWSDTDINAGDAWEDEIKKHLDSANVILLLVSPDFMDSDYCYSIEMERAMQRHTKKEARVIPIILRPTNWKGAPFDTLQVLPTNAKPVTDRRSWFTEDEALNDVSVHISTIAIDLLKDQWLAEGNDHYKAKLYDKALLAYNQTLKLDSKCVAAYIGKGDTLREQNEFDEAIVAYDQAITLDSNNAIIHNAKGSAFEKSRRNQEALAEYEKAIQLDPTHIWAWYSKGNIHYQLGQYNDALLAYEQVGELTPDEATFHQKKGYALETVGRFKEALAEAERAITLNPNSALSWRNKGEALRRIGNFNGALAAYEQAIELDPNYPNGYNGRGMILYRENKSQEALADFERAIKLNPKYMWAWEHKARVLERLAQQAHEKARQLGYKEVEEKWQPQLDLQSKPEEINKNMSLPEFIQYIKKRWDLTPSDAMDLLKLQNLNNIEYAQIIEQLQTLVLE